jgi:hypothetical protein
MAFRFFVSYESTCAFMPALVRFRGGEIVVTLKALKESIALASYGGSVWRSKYWGVFVVLLLMACSARANTHISSPRPGDQIDGDSVTFSLVNWFGNASSMWIYVGSSPGARDLHDSGRIDGDTDQWMVNGLPVNSSRIYVRFFYLRDHHRWEYVDHEYYADDRAKDGTPYLTSPVNRSILTSSQVEFDWTPVLYRATRYWLYIGSAPGARDVFDSGPLQGSPSSTVASSLPSDGRALYVRFWWYRVDTGWEYQDYRYHAWSGQEKPFLTYPINQTTASDGTSLYTNLYFSEALYDVEDYWIYVGSGIGRKDFYDTGRISGTTISGPRTSERVIFPKNGRTVYVRFYYRQPGSPWEYSDYQFKSGGPAATPYMSVPRPGNDGLFSRTRFIWDSALYEPSDYWLYIGTAPHRADIYDSGLLPGSARDVTIDLPPGATIYTTLYYRRDGGKWFHHDASYKVR